MKTPAQRRAKRLYDRAYRQKNRVRIREYNRKRWAAEPQKRKARTAVASAIRAGRLVRPKNCQYCGKRKKTHAHHADYSKPLSVTFPCVPCHAKL